MDHAHSCPLMRRGSSTLSVGVGSNNGNSMEDDDVVSLGSLGSSAADGDDDDPLVGRDLDTENLARLENQAVSRLRGAVVWVLIGAAVMVSAAVFGNTKHSQLAQFEQAFGDSAGRVLNQFAYQMQTRLQACDALAVDAAAYAQTLHLEWPGVTMQDFCTRAAAAQNLAQAKSVLWLPIVTRETRSYWEDYSVNHTSWIDTQSSSSSNNEEEAVVVGDVVVTSTTSTTRRRSLVLKDENDHDDATHISPHIFNQDGIAAGPGPFAPLWQTAPVPADVASWVNFDSLALDGLKGGLKALLESGLAVVGEVVEDQQSFMATTTTTTTTTVGSDATASENDTTASSNNNDIDMEPISAIFYPIFATDHNSNKDSSSTGVVAVLAFVSSWKFYFDNVLTPSVSGLVAVVENTCDQAFTFEINGSKAKYLGRGDLHNTDFTSMRKSQGFETLNSHLDELQQSQQQQQRHHHVHLNTDYCTYTLHVYPSYQMKDEYVTHQPILYAVLVSLIFVFASILFASYDCLVERRQQVVMDHAIQSTAIVSSLFPEQVRERLFRRNSVASLLGNGDPITDQPGFGSGGTAAAAASGGDDGSFVVFESANSRLKSFLDKGGTDVEHGSGAVGSGMGSCAHRESATNASAAAAAANNNNDETKPIADLFPSCTVCFADIAGFTAWSSIRDPAQVFTLLEAVYQTFDKIARKRGVFKVETIGDSYVAVTGLPDPQEDHAVIMTRFARDCRAKMEEVTSKLVLTLGPDTCDLKMRFGLHSGPVTAGVLRGERSRFQLFGDTVNTAARMESTGEKDRIQMSQATADCLRNAGKGHWIKPRAELVHAKGKGKLQTYFFEPGNSRRSISSVCSEDSSSTRASRSSVKSVIWGAPEETVSDRKLERNKHMRLINYNVDLLATILKQVVARRQMLEMAGLWEPDGGPPPYNEYNGEGPTVLEEVVEVIELPKFDARAFSQYVDPDSIDLGPAVMAQLKRFVTLIGAMYRSNPFHNFEHASHVTMSVNKLLQRVVAPEIRVRRRSVTGRCGYAGQMASDLHNYTHGITSDPLTQFAVVFSALIHDVDHWGVSNGQLVKEGVPIAQKYNNKTIAEQNSVDLAFDLLMNPEDYPDLQACIFPTNSEYQRFRQVVVNLVMATDIFDPELAELSEKRWSKAFNEQGAEAGSDSANRKATVVIEHIMQASDVAHSMQHWLVYQRWNRRLFDELYTAYRAGRMGADPSTFWVEGELKFFDNHIIPLATKLKQCGVFGVASDECLNYAMNNRREWCVQGQTIVDELVANYHKREQEEKQKKEQAEAEGGRGNKNRRRFARRRSLFTSAG